VPFFDLATQTGRGTVAGPPVPLGISLAQGITLRSEPPSDLPNREVDRSGQLGTGGTFAQVTKPPLKHRDHSRDTRTGRVVH
jgi:hypothetical protein